MKDHSITERPGTVASYNVLSLLNLDTMLLNPLTRMLTRLLRDIGLDISSFGKTSNVTQFLTIALRTTVVAALFAGSGAIVKYYKEWASQSELAPDHQESVPTTDDVSPIPDRLHRES